MADFIIFFRAFSKFYKNKKLLSTNFWKELNLCNKIKYLNPNIFRTRCCKPLIFQTLIIWSSRIHSLKYQRSTTFGSKDIVIRKSEFVTKTNSFQEKCVLKCFPNTTKISLTLKVQCCKIKIVKILGAIFRLRPLFCLNPLNNCCGIKQRKLIVPKDWLTAMTLKRLYLKISFPPTDFLSYYLIKFFQKMELETSYFHLSDWYCQIQIFSLPSLSICSQGAFSFNLPVNLSGGIAILDGKQLDIEIGKLFWTN